MDNLQTIVFVIRFMQLHFDIARIVLFQHIKLIYHQKIRLF